MHKYWIWSNDLIEIGAIMQCGLWWNLKEECKASTRRIMGGLCGEKLWSKPWDTRITLFFHPSPYYLSYKLPILKQHPMSLSYDSALNLTAVTTTNMPSVYNHSLIILLFLRARLLIEVFVYVCVCVYIWEKLLLNQTQKQTVPLIHGLSDLLIV